MYKIEYGEERKYIASYLGVDVATGSGKGDFSALVLIERFQEKTLIQGFPDKVVTSEHFMITDLQRTRDLNLDTQVQWLRSYVESLSFKPFILIDATRELSFALSVKEQLREHVVGRVIWTAGSSITRDGTKFLVGKSQVLLDLKAFIALGKLTLAPDLSLNDELIKELSGLSFIDSAGGGFTIKSGAKNDDLTMALAAGVVPLLARGVLERSAPRAEKNFLNYNQSYDTGMK
jgi:hypothetical protein